jgi:small neutral amino acid transporter SnatA (MarC family)
MPIDRETLYQVIVSAGAVALFIAVAAVVTTTEQNGLALVGTIALFIVLMAVAGLWLERQDFDGDEA